MERTESVVIPVAPEYENEKIAEMQTFGWNLHGRQEIQEKGDAYGRPSFLDSGTYIIKTTVYNYVKLHFVRDLALPNLARIREIEHEYFNLPFPAPTSLKPAGCLMGCGSFWLLTAFLGTILAVVFRSEEASAPGLDVSSLISGGIFSIILGGACILVGVSLMRSRRRQRQENATTCETSRRRAETLRSEASALL